MTEVALLSLRIGSVAPLGARGMPSGIVKSPVDYALALITTGLVGDTLGDTVRHGGLEKAVHHYPFEHYADWTSDLGPHPLLADPGALLQKSG